MDVTDLTCFLIFSKIGLVKLCLICNNCISCYKNPIWGYSRWSTFCLVCPICFCWLSLPFDEAKTRSLLQLTYKLSWLTRMFSIQHVVLSFCQKCICRSFLEQVLDATTAILHTLLVLFLLPATCKLCRAFDAYKSAFFVSKHIPGL